MSVIACASGKGGTGKTTVATNLARLLSANAEVHLLDCDVEGPNDHLFFDFDPTEQEPVEVPLPKVDLERCDGCGVCSDACTFNAISVLGEKVLVFPELCHSCGVCAYVCPRDAVSEEPRTIGVLTHASVGTMIFTGGELFPGEPLAPPIIQAVKKTISPGNITLIDAAPGTSCPTVEAIHGADFCVLVTEPTAFGLGDLQMAVGMGRRLGVPLGIVINRCNLGDDRVEAYCHEEALPILARFPLDLDLARCYARGALVVDHSEGWRDRFRQLGNAIKHGLKGGR